MLTPHRNSPLVPVISLSLFAIASGFLMSLIPLALDERGMSLNLASWLASVFYAGVLGGALSNTKVIYKFGHLNALVAFLLVIVSTICIMAFFSTPVVWLGSRFIAGIAVAGVFVVIESWLLMAETEKARARRLGLYMIALYGGAALSQLGIGLFGTVGAIPMMIVAGVMSTAILPPLVFRNDSPKKIVHPRIKLREMNKLPSAAYIGCIVSGLVLGVIYGLLPLELESKFSHDQVGTLMALVILGGMSVQPLISWLNVRVEKALLMAIFCFTGLLSIAMIEIATMTGGTIAGLFLLGVSAFALYPIAITLACMKVCESKIISVTELMLLSYCIGSVIGPVVAGHVMGAQEGLMIYFAVCFAATLIYMLISIKYSRRRTLLSHSSVDSKSQYD